MITQFFSKKKTIFDKNTKLALKIESKNWNKSMKKETINMSYEENMCNLRSISQRHKGHDFTGGEQSAQQHIWPHDKNITLDCKRNINLRINYEISRKKNTSYNVS